MSAIPNNWKFQGQEHVDDLDLNWVSFKWRNHQPDIGRFFNVDPLAEDYVYNSPYAFSENMVTAHIELEGLESWYAADGNVLHGPRSGNARKGRGLVPASTISNIAKGTNAGLKQRYQLESVRGDTKAGIRDTRSGRIKSGKPVGDWAIRVDKQHAGTRGPHININPKLSGVPDPHTPISSNTLQGLTKLGKGVKIAGNVAKPLGVIVDGVRIQQAYELDGGTIGENTIVETSGVAGGWAGAWAGAVLGATGGIKVGGAIGTLFGPGPGNAVGAAIGGIVGGIGGGIMGAFAGDNAGQAAGKVIADEVLDDE